MPIKTWRVVVGIACALAGHSMALGQQAPESAAAGEPTLSEVVVSVRRQDESALDVPESLTAFGSTAISELNIQSFDDYATKIPNLSFSYGTGGLGYGGSRTIAIRGIAGTGGTTALYIDDTPVPETIDPQVVDIERIEVLKGPQGTLFGQGSLGGNVRLITKQPNLDDESLSFGMQGGYTDRGGSADYRADIVQNFVLSPDRLAVRVVAFDSHDAGFVTRTYPNPMYPGTTSSSSDQGALYQHGGSVSARLQVSDQFSATARFLTQRDESIGLPTVYAPLPAFLPTPVYTLNREVDQPEGYTDNYYLPSLDLKYAGDGWSVVSSTSYFQRDQTNLEDGTEGTRQYLQTYYGASPALGADGIPWSGETTDHRFQEEVRATFAESHHLSGVVGTRYAVDRTDTQWWGGQNGLTPGIAAEGLFPTDLDYYGNFAETTKDYSVFGEGYFRLDRAELTVGLRQYWLRQLSSTYVNGLINGGETSANGLTSNASGLNPRVALSYKPTDDTLVYASASKGYRQGQPNSPIPGICDPGLQELGLTRGELAQSKPDIVWNYEVGGKAQVGRLTMTGALFQMNWTNIQQLLVIPVCLSGVETNAGAARNRGVEYELSGMPIPGLEIRVGLGYNDDRITAGGYSGQAVGSRIYQVPEVTGFAAATYTRSLFGNYEGFISVDDSYTGDSLSDTVLQASGTTNEPPPTRRAYDVLNGRLGVRWAKMELALYAKNLLNKEANLGDVNPISITRRDEQGYPMPRVALLTPLSVGIQFKYGF